MRCQVLLHNSILGATGDLNQQKFKGKKPGCEAPGEHYRSAHRVLLLCAVIQAEF